MSVKSSVSARCRLLAINFLPLLQAAVLLAFACSSMTFIPKAAAISGALYVIPPLLARLILSRGPILEGTFAENDPLFMRWWLIFQLQGLFNRLPVLEELLRIVPGLYSLWLRMWGSRIGRLTFWGAGTRVLDRTHLNIGDDVVFGAGVRLNPHVLKRNDAGEAQLVIAAIGIESGALIGGYALITAGSRVMQSESTRALLVMPPYTVFENGKRKHNLKTGTY